MGSTWSTPPSVLSPITVTVTGIGKGSRICAGSALRKDPRTERARGWADMGMGQGRGHQDGDPGLRKGDLPWDLVPSHLIDTLLSHTSSPTM